MSKKRCAVPDPESAIEIWSVCRVIQADEYLCPNGEHHYEATLYFRLPDRLWTGLTDFYCYPDQIPDCIELIEMSQEFSKVWRMELTFQ